MSRKLAAFEKLGDLSGRIRNHRAYRLAVFFVHQLDGFGRPEHGFTLKQIREWPHFVLHYGHDGGCPKRCSSVIALTLRVDTPCTYISASAATSAFSERW